MLGEMSLGYLEGPKTKNEIHLTPLQCYKPWFPAPCQTWLLHEDLEIFKFLGAMAELRAPEYGVDDSNFCVDRWKKSL